MKALATLGLILLQAASVLATVDVTTPALRLDSSSTAVCRISNFTGSSIAVDVSIIDSSTGSTLASDIALGIAYADAEELTYTGSSAVMYCVVAFDNNGEADASKVSLGVQDSSGMLVSAVQGVRVGSHVGTSSVITPSMDSGATTYECSALNTDSSAQSVQFWFCGDTGCNSTALSINPGRAHTRTLSEAPVYCWIVASGGAVANKFRVAVYESISGVGSGPALAGN